MHNSDEYTELSGMATSFESWESLLGRLRRIERGTVSMLVSYDLAHRHGHIDAADSVARSYRRSYGELYAAHDPWAARVRDLALPGTVWSGDQILSDAERVTSRYYTEWLKPQGITHIIRGVLSRDREEILFVDVGRGDEAGDYQQTDVDRYHWMLPKLQRGASLRLVVDRLRWRSEAALRLLDMIPIGMVIVGPEGHPVIVNRYARDLLSASGRNAENLLAMLQMQLDRADHLRQSSRSPKVHERVAVSRMKAMDATHSISIPRPGGLRPLSALTVPLSMACDDGGEDALSCLVLISDPDHGVSLNRERLQEIYGLTPAEARLAALLAQGKHLKTAAAELGISLETARTHLKRVFSKTTSGGQADLVRLLLNLENQVGSSS